MNQAQFAPARTAIIPGPRTNPFVPLADAVFLKMDLSLGPSRKLADMGYVGPYFSVLQLCHDLAAMKKSGVFYLSGAKAGSPFGLNDAMGYRTMMSMVHQGILEVVSTGNWGRANEYRFIWPDPIFDATKDELEHDPS